eukprot:1174662-Pyramimonas_sp.AAC.1
MPALPASDWSVVRIYLQGADELLAYVNAGNADRLVAATNLNANSSRTHTVVQLTLSQVRALIRLACRENMPALPASDWSVVRIYPRFLRLIGPS